MGAAGYRLAVSLIRRGSQSAHLLRQRLLIRTVGHPDRREHGVVQQFWKRLLGHINEHLLHDRVAATGVIPFACWRSLNANCRCIRRSFSVQHLHEARYRRTGRIACETVHRCPTCMGQQLAQRPRLSSRNRRIRQLPAGQHRVHIRIERELPDLYLMQRRHRSHRLTDRACLEQCLCRNRRPTHTHHSKPLRPVDHAMMYYGDAHAVNMERRHPLAQTMAGVRIVFAHNRRQETGLHVLDVFARLGRDDRRRLRQRNRRRTRDKQEQNDSLKKNRHRHPPENASYANKHSAKRQCSFVRAKSHPLDAPGVHWQIQVLNRLPYRNIYLDRASNIKKGGPTGCRSASIALQRSFQTPSQAASLLRNNAWPISLKRSNSPTKLALITSAWANTIAPNISTPLPLLFSPPPPPAPKPSALPLLSRFSALPTRSASSKTLPPSI